MLVGSVPYASPPATYSFGIQSKRLFLIRPLRQFFCMRQNFRTFFSGSTRKVGSKRSTPPDPTGHGIIQRVPWGALNRALPAPYSPVSALGVENHYLGSWVCQSVLGTERVHCTGPPQPNLARIPPKLPPRVAESNGGTTPTPVF